VVSSRWSNCSLSTNFHSSSQGDVSRQTHFLFWGHHLSCLFTQSFGTRLFSLGLCQKQGVWDTFFQYRWHETVNLRMHSRNPQLSHTTCYDIHVTLAAQVFWTTRWSPWRCHIQTIMFKTNSWWKLKCIYFANIFFWFALKSYFISKTIRCFWCTLFLRITL
jgi:hypothetical protein